MRLLGLSNEHISQARLVLTRQATLDLAPRTVLIRRIGKAAKRAGVAWVFVRQGGNHEVWSCASTMVTIPRHREISELTAQGIMKDLEIALGKGWWMK